jgi:hypothetical protein
MTALHALAIAPDAIRMALPSVRLWDALARNWTPLQAWPGCRRLPELGVEKVLGRSEASSIRNSVEAAVL